MRCRKARKLIQELMDGALGDRRELDAHLGGCTACRRELAALQQIDAAVRDVVTCDVPEEALNRLSAGVLPALAAQEARPVGIFALRWAAAAMIAAALLAGLAAGRWLWPRQVTVTRVERVTEVREKIVEVEVPVVKVEERVVVKRVPVTRTEVVYRDPPERPPAALWASPGPVRLEPIRIRIDTTPAPPAPELRQQVRPAALAEKAGEEDTPSPER
ncbi:MAG: anti-sigma factor family protein [Armatimonadota bacterium]